MTPCSPPSRRGLSAAECEAPFERRPSLTASVRDVVGAAGRDEETVLRSNQETEFIRSRRLRRLGAGGVSTAGGRPPGGWRGLEAFWRGVTARGCALFRAAPASHRET